MEPDASAVILDGGRARRFGGRHKAFVAVEGVPIALRLLAVLRALFGDVVVVTSRPQPWTVLGVRTVADDVPDAGPLAGIAAGLAAAHHALAFVVASDMPFVSPAVVAYLLERARDADRPVVPRVGGRAEPLHAVYPATLARAAAEAVRGGMRRPADFLESVGVLWVDSSELAALPGASDTFRDVDSPDDVPGR